jgi:SPX domain
MLTTMVASSSSTDNQQQLQQQEQLFLTRLRKEMEKVSLFTLKRQGELADAIGALRFQNEALQILSPGRQQRLQQLQRNGSGRTRFAATATVPEFDEDDDDCEAGDVEDDSNLLTGALGEKAALLPTGSIATGPLQTPRPMAKSASSQPIFRGGGITLLLPTSATSCDSKNATADSYAALGVELLHLLRFLCVNATGYRKIVKKHDKLLSSTIQLHPHHSPSTTAVFGGLEDHLTHLANSASIAAIHASLLAALKELMDQDEDYRRKCRNVTSVLAGGEMVRNKWPDVRKDDDEHEISLLRFQCVVESIHILREYAERMNAPFRAFLSHRAMTLTTETQQALVLLVRFQPDSLLYMDKGALVDWKDRTVARKESGSHSNHQTNMIMVEGKDSWGGVNGVSMMINLISTLLYTVRYELSLWRYCPT